MQYQTNQGAAAARPLTNLPSLLSWHQKAVVDNVAYFSDLACDKFTIKNEKLDDVYAQLDRLYLENMSQSDKDTLTSAYMQIDIVLSAKHSMVDKMRQIEHLHTKIDTVITNVVANFDDVSQQRLLFLSEHL